MTANGIPTKALSLSSPTKKFHFAAIGSDAVDTEIRLIRPGKETEVIYFGGPIKIDFETNEEYVEYTEALEDWNKEMINRIPGILSRVIAFAEGG